jgi:hypothetical protein
MNVAGKRIRGGNGSGTLTLMPLDVFHLRSLSRLASAAIVGCTAARK